MKDLLSLFDYLAVWRHPTVWVSHDNGRNYKRHESYLITLLWLPVYILCFVPGGIALILFIKGFEAVMNVVMGLLGERE